ncbi:MAG: ribonuclease III [Myxococcales bacterium]|nr:ribonuclease III [Myxococcales bacterium]MCB9522341.1 ribonuclease III [Myxococcales bacterium]
MTEGGPDLSRVDPEDRPLAALAARLGYPPGERGQLQVAVTHKSYANERRRDVPYNERLEFLGDAVLGAVVAEALMRAHPGRDEGQLSRLRASIVNAVSLAEVAADIGIGPALRLGRGEERSGGRSKHNVLADAFEACLGAVYLDLGYGAARRVVLTHYAAAICKGESRRGHRDHKTRLQEAAQAVLQIAPSYHLVEARGPDHEKEFEVELRLGALTTRGVGRSKKAAERAAAAEALDALNRMRAAKAEETP